MAEGRAVHRSGTAYAVGSDAPLGLWNLAVTTSLTETSPDYWEHTVDGC